MTIVGTVISAYESERGIVDVVLTAMAQTDRVVVVDDGSPSLADPESPVHDILEACAAAGAVVVRTPDNRGIAHALNTGVRDVLDHGVDAVLTLDQDTLIADDYIVRALAHLELATSLQVRDVMLSPAFINDDVAPFWHAERGLTLAFEPIQSGLVITAPLLERIGLFDESLFIDCVETEFYLRARAAGGHALIVPGGRMEHRLGRPTSWAPPAALRAILRRDRVEFNEDAPFRHYYIARNRTALYRRYARTEPLWTVVSIGKDAFLRGRAMTIGSRRSERVGFTAAGLVAGMRGETGRIPVEVEARRAPVVTAAPASGDRPAEPDRGLPEFVSVVIPAFNAVDVIDAQLDAPAAQDYSHRFEVVVADNGSSDGLREHLAGHRLAADLNLRWVDASAGRGASVARNIGVQQADGDFIAFCDADDRAHPQWLTALTEVARTHSAVGGAVETTSLNTRHVREWRDMLPPGEPYEIAGFLRVWPTCNLGVWTDVFDRVGGFDPAYDRGGEDSDFTLRVQLAGGVLGQAPDALMGYRLRDSLRGLWDQSVMCGEGNVRLYSDYRDYGLPRMPWYAAVDVVAYLLLRNPLLPSWLTRSTTGRWIFHLGNLVGRIKGSLRHRVWYV